MVKDGIYRRVHDNVPTVCHGKDDKSGTKTLFCAYLLHGLSQSVSEISGWP